MQARTLSWLLRYEWCLWCRDPRGLKLWRECAKVVLIFFAIALPFCTGFIGFASISTAAHTELQELQQMFAKDPDRALWSAAGFLIFFASCPSWILWTTFARFSPVPPP